LTVTFASFNCMCFWHKLVAEWKLSKEFKNLCFIYSQPTHDWQGCWKLWHAAFVWTVQLIPHSSLVHMW